MKPGDIAPVKQEALPLRAPLTEEQREQLRRLAASIEAIRARAKAAAK
jgi:hypothetical protein